QKAPTRPVNCQALNCPLNCQKSADRQRKARPAAGGGFCAGDRLDRIEDHPASFFPVACSPLFPPCPLKLCLIAPASASCCSIATAAPLLASASTGRSTST